MTAIRTLTPAAAAIFALSLALPAPAAAQRPAVERPETTPVAQVAPQFLNQDQDAQETREKLEEVVRRLPPAVGRVLRTDPSLLANETYLATYPTLSLFLKAHPEVRSSPDFFFEHIGPATFWTPGQQESSAVRTMRDMLQFFAISSIFLIVTAGVIWIIKTLVEYRRWNRTSKVHTEVHNKLMDRFTANEDLLSYLSTPAAQRFLESAPLSLEAPARPVGAPFTRILWSAQVGIVLIAGAIGLLFVSGRVVDEVAQVFFAIGTIALAVGAGFVVSAGASFILSRRLGLFDPPVTPRERLESSGQ